MPVECNFDWYFPCTIQYLGFENVKLNDLKMSDTIKVQLCLLAVIKTSRHNIIGAEARFIDINGLGGIRDKKQRDFSQIVPDSSCFSRMCLGSRIPDPVLCGGL